jgi:hypothetical protein
MHPRWTKPGAARLLALAATAAVALAGCGGEKKKPVGPDLTAMRCPAAKVGDPPAKGSFDTGELIGKRLEDAQKLAAGHGCRIVVSMADGAGQPVPIEVDPKLIFVFTAKGVVSDVEGVGGGI